ncbi:thioredoxin family protein [Pedobacter gandavensis]|uniref:thioredoxin family protein n=1 Tax=Pedobacter gandavensis TaxID=2679963 RepID=UPI00292E95BB|nr:thioredoxin family protein [Pedobacter gandavensis]
MKKLITFTLLLFAMTASSQEINKKTKDDTGKVTGLINICSRAGLQALSDTQHKYDIEYPAYQPDQPTLAALQPLMKDKKITIVMGTWCGDSQLQVPHFYKMLDALNFKESDITLICVDHSKKAENGLIDGMNISHVPTFIVTENGKELGRITETPIVTLEKDMLSIFAKK